MEGVSAEILARHCGLSSTVVASFARRGVMVRTGRGRFDLEASVRSYCQHLREQASGRKAGDAPMKDRARLAKAMADSVEQKTAIRAGKLVDAEAVAREWEGICSSLRAGILRVPKRAAARLPHLTQQDVCAIDAEVRALVTELVNSATGDRSWST